MPDLKYNAIFYVCVRFGRICKIENEIRDNAEGLSGSLANEEQSQITVDESSTLGDEGDAAINCNWNIKVYIEH